MLFSPKEKGSTVVEVAILLGLCAIAIYRGLKFLDDSKKGIFE